VNASLQQISKMNVSKEADAAFMTELKRTDRPRYDRLVKAMQVHTLGRLPKVIEISGRRCLHCGLPLPEGLRQDGQHCDAACKQADYRSRKAA
jgi:hypothetical protein